MNEIFDINKLPERRLSIRCMISIDSRIDIGEVIHMSKQKMARQLAQKIIDDDQFFWSRDDKIAQFSTLEYGADCIVLTQEEYAQLKRQSFKEGVEHASGFMRPFGDYK
jgi:hypothetical protein